MGVLSFLGINLLVELNQIRNRVRISTTATPEQWFLIIVLDTYSNYGDTILENQNGDYNTIALVRIQCWMEMVKLCSYFLLIKCLGSSAWPERCLGKAKVAGSIPAQGFLLSFVYEKKYNLGFVHQYTGFWLQYTVFESL